MSFVHLNVHSNHSLLAGTSTIEDLVWAASKFGMEALALTDTNGLYGAVPFQQACTAAGIRPIFGAEVDEPAAREGEAPAGLPFSRAVLLAHNKQGYAEICRLVTERHLGRRWRDLLGRRAGKAVPPEEAPFDLAGAIRRPW